MAAPEFPVTIQAGDVTGPVVYGGVLTLPANFVFPAVVDASNLPTSDPGHVGQVYADSGVLTVSSG